MEQQIGFRDKYVFFEKHNLSGSQLALVVNVALRLTLSDLRYRWWNAAVIRTCIWIAFLVIVTVLPLFTLLPLKFFLKLFPLLTEVSIVWIYILGYFITGAFYAHLFFRTKIKSYYDKAIRRDEIYNLAILYKKQFIINR